MPRTAPKEESGMRSSRPVKHWNNELGRNARDGRQRILCDGYFVLGLCKLSAAKSCTAHNCEREEPYGHDRGQEGVGVKPLIESLLLVRGHLQIVFGSRHKTHDILPTTLKKAR